MSKASATGYNFKIANNAKAERKQAMDKGADFFFLQNSCFILLLKPQLWESHESLRIFKNIKVTLDDLWKKGGTINFPS